MPFFFKISDSYEPFSLKAAIAIAPFAPITFQTTTITQKMYVITKHVKRDLEWTKSIMTLTKCKISRGGNFRQILWMQISLNINYQNLGMFVKAFISMLYIIRNRA